MKEALLVRFEKHERAIIRKKSRKLKISEAEYVRRCVNYPVVECVEWQTPEQVFGKN